MTKNEYIPFRSEILEVIEHTPIEYTFRMAYKGDVKPGQFFEVSLPKFGEAPISVSGIGEDFVDLTIRRVGKVTNEIFKNYDLIIGPTNTSTAYKLGTKQDDALKSFYDDLLTIPVNMAGLPAMSLPIGKNSNSLPIGMHIIASYFKEDQIYQLASFIEEKLKEVILRK